MRLLFIVLILSVFLQNISFSQIDSNQNYIYVDELTFYIHFKEPGKKSYCLTVNRNANLDLKESQNNSCENKTIDHEVLIEKDHSYSITPKTNKLLSGGDFRNPVFAFKIAVQAVVLGIKLLINS